MTANVAGLIAVPVTRRNARAVEDACQAELCEASARGDLSDFLAVQGKLHQARAVRTRPVDCGEPGFALREILFTCSRGL